MKEGVHLYGGFAGNEVARDQRNCNTRVTTIDGEDIRRGVLGANNATLDGFVITRGYNQPLGGSGMLNQSSPTIANCIFTRNMDHGILNNGPVSPIITNCTFADTQVQGYGLVSDSGATPIISNCTFYNNRHGIESNEHAVTSVTNCVVFGNSRGVVAVNGAAVTLVNCTIAANAMAGVLTSASGSGDGAASLVNCIVWGNAEGIRGGAIAAYSDIQGGYADTGNINANPGFVDAANADYHLQGNSPCIDTGTTTGAPDTDIEGTTRPQGPGVDMGAYEMYDANDTPELPLYAWPATIALFAVACLAVRRRNRKI
jgi:hypothetical protein